MERFQIFQCQEEHCKTWVEVLVGCDCGDTCDMVCCDKPMKALVEQTADSTKEKHVPLIQAVPEGTKVVVGSTLHPMLEAHYIAMIELIDGDFTYRKYLKPGDAPEAIFPVKAKNPVARELCNLHGLWKG
jgi:superoxide reductase